MQKHLKSIIMAISVILVIIACFWIFDHRQQQAEQELREQLNGLKLQYAPAERDTIRDSVRVITQQVLTEHTLELAFRAIAEATQEAVLNSLSCADDVKAADGRVFEGIGKYLSEA